MRISQFLILPPFQKQGHGKELYTFLYNYFLNDIQVHDITVEDPNDDFQSMRETCDVNRILRDGSILDQLNPSQVAKEHIKEIQTKFKFGEVGL